MNSNTFVYKYAFAVTLPKICKNDLVIIPKKLAK
jgi:nonsense-mediated mRNA decay protein 3